MTARLFAAMTAALFLYAVAAAQDYTIRVTHKSNLRQTYSLDAAIIETAPAGVTLQVVGRVNRWLKINRNGKELWMADWIDYTRVEDSAQPSSQTATVAQIDNCCFVDRQCHSDQDWTNGYHAFQNGQCAAPPQSQPGASAQPASIVPAQIDNCCFAGWQCNSDQDWTRGYHAYQNGQCAAPPHAASPAFSIATAQVDNCCLAGWHCINDQEWTNGLHAFQNNDCVGSPRIPSGASCCQMGWNCTLPSDRIMGVWFIREGWQCDIPAQANYAGVIIDGSRIFIARVIEALDLLKSRAPEWYAYVITGPLKIREWLGSHALERSFNLASSHAAEDVVRRASTILHESCHVQRWRVRLLRYENDLQQRTEENLCELVVDYMLDSVQPVRPHNEILEFEVNRLIAEGVNIHDLANTEQQRAIHLLTTIS